MGRTLSAGLSKSLQTHKQARAHNHISSPLPWARHKHTTHTQPTQRERQTHQIMNSFNGFPPVSRCHPSRYLLIKLGSSLSYRWTHRGSQLFVSLSKSNWLRLCYIQPFSHPVSPLPSKVTAGFALSKSQIGFSFPRKHLCPKSTILPLPLTNDPRIIISSDHSVSVIINLMVLMHLVGISDHSYLLSFTQEWTAIQTPVAQ